MHDSKLYEALYDGRIYVFVRMVWILLIKFLSFIHMVGVAYDFASEAGNHLSAASKPSAGASW